MKFSICIIFSIICLSVYGQNKSISKIVNNIDSIVLSLKTQKAFELQECDSIADINGHKKYKCFKYYFEDSSMKTVLKVSISFNNCAEDLYCYYNANKVIKIEHYSIVDCKYQTKYSVYINNDREIYTTGNRGTIRYNEVESGYYFLNLAMDYAQKRQLL